MDTQRQNFWKESIDNEVTIRNKWFQEHMSNGIKLNMDNEPAKSRKIIKVSEIVDFRCILLQKRLVSMNCINMALSNLKQKSIPLRFSRSSSRQLPLLNPSIQSR